MKREEANDVVAIIIICVTAAIIIAITGTVAFFQWRQRKAAAAARREATIALQNVHGRDHALFNDPMRGGWGCRFGHGQFGRT